MEYFGDHRLSQLVDYPELVAHLHEDATLLGGEGDFSYLLAFVVE